MHQVGQPWQPPPPGPPQNVLAIVGLVCSISSLVLLVVAPFTFGLSMIVSGPLAIAGLICGLLGRQRADRGEVVTGRSMAQAAFLLGIASVVLHVLAVIVGVILLGLILDALGDLDLPEPDNPPGPGDPVPPPETDPTF